MRYKCGCMISKKISLEGRNIEDYEEWSKTVGIFGDRTKCWECWCKE